MDSLVEGVVVEIDGDTAKVRVSRHGDCSGCGSCPGDQAMTLDASNGLGASQGQRVLVELPEEGLVKSAFVVFALPLLALFAGAGLGYGAASFLGRAPLVFEILGAAVLFAASLAYIRLFDRAAAKRPLRATIVKTCN